MKKTTLPAGDKISLLAPEGEFKYFSLGENTSNDLAVDFIAENISDNASEKEIIRNILLEMPTDERVINYRREVYSELKENEELCEMLYRIFDSLRFYFNDKPTHIGETSTILEFLNRLRALEGYISSILQIRDVISDREFRSEGMRRFAAHVRDIYTNSGFDELEKDISVVGDDIHNIKSMTIGVNFDHSFYPKETGIISFNKFYFTRQGVLKRFIRSRRESLNDKDLQFFEMEMHNDGFDWMDQKYRGIPSPTNRPTDSLLMNNLNTIMERMLPSMTQKLKKVLNKYVDVSGRNLVTLADEFLFYMRFIGLEKKLAELGMPCCIGEISENDSFLRDFYNVKLTICRLNGMVDEDIVCNDIEFTNDRTVHILTGPNRGGKTILTQGVGLVFLMEQTGVFVPASSARIRPCDGIYTHFPVDEEKTVSLGRLGEEADRFNSICRTAGRDSLLLFNESFATTSHTESLYIAEDVLKYLCCIGARTVFNTHMHELAENADQISSVEGAVCKADSVVMDSSNGERSYKISYKKPDGKSYAHDIAYKYGITFEQLSEKLKK